MSDRPTMEAMRQSERAREAHEARQDGERLLFLSYDEGAIWALADLRETLRGSEHPLNTLRATIDIWRKQAAEESA